MKKSPEFLKAAVAALLGALACAGCATGRTDVSALGAVDEEGCVLRARVELSDLATPASRPVDSSWPFRTDGMTLASYGDYSGPVPPTARDANKVVRRSSYVDYLACPKTTLPEKQPD